MFRRFLYFSKSDRRAISTLIAMAIIAIAIAVYLDSSKDENKESTDEYAEKTISKVKKNTNSSTFYSKESPNSLNAENLPNFDPNTVDSATLAMFGIKDWKIRNLIKYRLAGGTFKEPNSISKLYGWTKEEVARILPYVYISDEFKNKRRNYSEERHYNTSGDRANKRESYDEYAKNTTSYRSNKFQNDTIIDVNTADSAMLKRIPGIGKGISKAIIEYRRKLGGFYSTDQLLEIKIFSPELQKWFCADQSHITRININKDSFQKINAHPYISYEQTKSILNYRRLYGEFKDLEQLQSNIFTEMELNRAKHYIEF